MLKVILDTNVFINALSKNRDCLEILYREYLGEFQTYSSNAMAEELLYVYKHEIFPNDNSSKDYILETMYRWIRIFRRSISINTTKRLNIIKEDLSDNMFLECACESDVDIIVTSDGHFEVAKDKIFNKNNKVVKIYSNEEFLEVLRKQDSQKQVAIGE